jgi:RHS repeat-associated protein
VAVERVKRYSDLNAGTLVGVTTYSYDNADRVTNIHSQDGAANDLSSITYAYDSADRVTTQTSDGAAPVSYTYDADNQLLTDASNTYSFDAAGNRNMTGYTVGADNQVSTDGTWNYSYDAEGNLAKKVLILTGETWTYGYDERNQMAWAEDRATDGGTLLQREDFTYDVFGNLLQTSVGSLTTRYGLDTGTAEVWSELDGTSALQTRLIRPDSVDGLAAKETSAGTVSWYLQDRLGSVVALTTLTGTVLDKRTYDGFGKIATETAPLAGDHWGYTGKLFESTVGLQYNIHRWYNPATGTWTTQDDTRFQAGDYNLTRYAGNNATNATDPSGLFDLDTVMNKLLPQLDPIVYDFWDQNVRAKVGKVDSPRFVGNNSTVWYNAVPGQRFDRVNVFIDQAWSNERAVAYFISSIRREKAFWSYVKDRGASRAQELSKISDSAVKTFLQWYGTPSELGEEQLGLLTSDEFAAVSQSFRLDQQWKTAGADVESKLAGNPALKAELDRQLEEFIKDTRLRFEKSTAGLDAAKRAELAPWLYGKYTYMKPLASVDGNGDWTFQFVPTPAMRALQFMQARQMHRYPPSVACDNVPVPATNDEAATWFFALGTRDYHHPIVESGLIQTGLIEDIAAAATGYWAARTAGATILRSLLTGATSGAFSLALGEPLEGALRSIDRTIGEGSGKKLVAAVIAAAVAKRVVLGKSAQGALLKKASKGTWSKPPNWQGPAASRGTWLGQEGNSVFRLNHATADAFGVPRGTAVRFVEGVPDYSPFVRPTPAGTSGVFEVPGLTGVHATDQPLIRAFLADQARISEAAVTRYLRANDLRIHHFRGSTVQLVPENIHQLHHTGGAAALRGD